MIDSSGRRALRANGTILDLLPVEQAIGITGVLLVALFTLIRPEASIGLGTAARVLFWILHVGLGLCALWVASRWLASGQRLPHGTLLCVLITGLAGIVIAAPGYMALDFLYSLYLSAQVTDEPDAPQSLIKTLANEIIEISPWFMASWLLINLPVLLPRPEVQTSMDDSVSPAPTTAKLDQPSTTTSNTDTHKQGLPELIDSSDDQDDDEQDAETNIAETENTTANPLTQ